MTWEGCLWEGNPWTSLAWGHFGSRVWFWNPRPPSPNSKGEGSTCLTQPEWDTSKVILASWVSHTHGQRLQKVRPAPMHISIAALMVLKSCSIRYLSEFDTWKWGKLPKIPWFKASFSLLELQFAGYTPFSDTPIFIFDIQGFTHPISSRYPTLDQFPITWKWRHSRQWSLGFRWQRPDQGKMLLKETNAVHSDIRLIRWRLHPESLQWGWIWFKGNLQEPSTLDLV